MERLKKLKSTRVCVRGHEYPRVEEYVHSVKWVVYEETVVKFLMLQFDSHRR